MAGVKLPVVDDEEDIPELVRRRLGSCGHYIETVRGVGYRFMDSPPAGG